MSVKGKVKKLNKKIENLDVILIGNSKIVTGRITNLSII